jgi:hypothetical protein
LILISTSPSASTNNIRAFIENGNNAVIECIQSVITRLLHSWSSTTRRHYRLPLMSTWMRSSR